MAVSTIKNHGVISKTFSKSSTFNANGAGDVIYDVALGGYTPLCAMLAQANHVNLVLINQTLQNNDTQAKITLRNLGSSAITNNIVIQVLYRPN